MGDYAIENYLQSYYNCKIVKSGIGDISISIKSKNKIGVKKILGFIPVYEYEILEKLIYFDKHLTIQRKNAVYDTLIYEQYLDVAYDDVNRVLYWKRCVK